MSTKQLLTLGDAFKKYGFDEEDLKYIKLIRFPLENPEIKKVYDEGFIDVYQGLQNESDFKGCKYLFSFIGESKDTARLIGCFENYGKYEDKEISKGYPFPKHFENNRTYFFTCNSYIENNFDRRLTIKWISKKSSFWANSKTAINMPVITNRTRVTLFIQKQFSVTDGVTYKELVEIFKEDDLNWKTALSEINAVYFVYSDYGKYIGSSYGDGGLWECLKQRVHEKDKFAGVKLRNKKIYKKFRYNILEILPKNTTQEEAFDYEKYYRDIYPGIPNFYETK